MDLRGGADGAASRLTLFSGLESRILQAPPLEEIPVLPRLIIAALLTLTVSGCAALEGLRAFVQAPKFEEAINRLLQQNRPKPTWAFVARPEEDEVFGWRVRSTV